MNGPDFDRSKCDSSGSPSKVRDVTLQRASITCDDLPDLVCHTQE